MFSNVTLRTKLLVPTFTLITVLLFLGFLVVSSNYATMRSLQELQGQIELSTRLSDAVHAFQKERGLTSGFLQKEGEEFKEELLRQRQVTDARIAALLGRLPPKPRRTPAAAYSTLTRYLEELPRIREAVDRRDLSYRRAIAFYSVLNTALLQIVREVAKNSHVPTVTQNLLAYINFLQMKEYAGLERAQGVVLLSKKGFDIDTYTTFTNLVALQKENERMFLGYASPAVAALYIHTLDGARFQAFHALEKTLLERSYLERPVAPKRWFDISTQKLNAMDRVGKGIERETTTLIADKLADARRFFYLIIALTIGSLVLFFLMVRIFLKLAKEEQRLRFVMDKYVISSVTDLKGRILDVSQAFCDISGYSRSELIGKNHNIVRHPDMPKEVFKELWTKLERDEAWSGKVKNLKKDGGFYWVYAHIEPLYNAKGEKDSYISVRLDITETELLTEKVRREEEKNRHQKEMMQQQHRLAQMGEMLSMIAHQWRQPLSAITAATASLETKSKLGRLDAETGERIAKKIKQVAQHLSATIDDFRNFFKTHRTPKPTDYRKIVDGVVTLVESSLKRHGIELEVQTLSLQPLETFESELKQVVLNLIKNAEEALVESRPANPRIVVTVEGARLRVEDNAGGIDPAVLPRIFDPYFSTKTQKDGTGLGLYMSKMIVEEHCGGRLTAENGPEGASFTIDLGGGHGRA
ncbi:nitrate- and nitrite sensing domain-containing protein [Hydrogenimonas sp.]